MKKIIALLISLVMVFSCMVGSYTALAESEFSKTIIDFDSTTANIAGGGSGTKEIIDYTTVDSDYADGNVLKLAPQQYQSVYVGLPKTWKEGNPIGLKFTVMAETELTLNRPALGISSKTSGDPLYNIDSMGGGGFSGHLVLAAGESFDLYYDFTTETVDFSSFAYLSYLVLKTETANSVFYIDNVSLFYETEKDIPAEHNNWEMIYDFEDEDISAIDTVNLSGNASYGGYKALSTDAYEGTYSLKAGKKGWDNYTTAVHFSNSFVTLPISSSIINDAYSIRLKYKLNNSQATAYFGVKVADKYYWSTTTAKGTSWDSFDFLYNFYTAYIFEDGTVTQDAAQGFYLTPDNIKNVTDICISANTNYSSMFVNVDNIEYAVACNHENYTVLASYDATCETGAYDEIQCNDCGKVVTLFNDSKPASGHNWVSEKVVDPSANVCGYTLYKCTNCNQTKKDDLTFLQALNHRFIAATNQIADDVEGTKYATLYTSLPTSEAKYTTKQDVDANIPYVTDATYSAGVGTFNDDAAGHCVTFGRNSSNVGDYIQFTFELDAGIYNFYTYSRSNNGRGTYSVTASANGESSIITNAYKQNTDGDTGTTLSKNDLGYLVVPKTSTVDFKFTCVSAGAMFFKALIFDSCSEVPEGVTPTYIADFELDPSVDISMESGAEIRLSIENGIRFITKVDSAKIAKLQSYGATVELGTLIAPADLIGSEELTFDLDKSKYVDVPYTATKDGCFEWHQDVDGQIAGSLLNIIETNSDFSVDNGNVARDFIGRGYVKVTIDGKTTITYAEYADGDIANNSRSLAYVANALKNDAANYEGLTDTQKELVDNWASKLK